MQTKLKHLKVEQRKKASQKQPERLFWASVAMAQQSILHEKNRT